MNSISQKRKAPNNPLEDILGNLNKRKKLTTQEKSSIDWDKFKKEEGIEDELKQATKGG